MQRSEGRRYRDTVEKNDEVCSMGEDDVSGKMKELRRPLFAIWAAEDSTECQRIVVRRLEEITTVLRC